MPMPRERLPDRRGHEVFDFHFSRGTHDRGHTDTVAVGRYGDGRIGEVFLDCHKLSSAMTDDARDVAVTLSIALQHGLTLETFAQGLTHHDDGRPCGLTGQRVDELVDYERRCGSSPAMIAGAAS